MMSQMEQLTTIKVGRLCLTCASSLLQCNALYLDSVNSANSSIHAPLAIRMISGRVCGHLCKILDFLEGGKEEGPWCHPTECSLAAGTQRIQGSCTDGHHLKIQVTKHRSGVLSGPATTLSRPNQMPPVAEGLPSLLQQVLKVPSPLGSCACFCEGQERKRSVRLKILNAGICVIQEGLEGLRGSDLHY